MPSVYVIWRCSVAIFAGLALLISFASNVLTFLEEGEKENISKYFIYLTNNGRLVAALALALEVRRAFVCCLKVNLVEIVLLLKLLYYKSDLCIISRLSLCPGGSWWREKKLRKRGTLSNARRDMLRATRQNCLFSSPFSGSCPTSPPPCPS